MSIDSISVVVTAPHGIAHCPYLDDLLSQADGQTLELVIADGASDYVDRSRVGLRHLSVPGGINALITEGVRQSFGEWVIVTEDHCRFLPGFIESYRDAIRDNPDVDVFSGAVDNLTSPSRWAGSIFMIGLRTYWTQSKRPPANAANANLMVRRSAILASELAVDGGLLNLTVRRLVEAGRYRHCPTAIVDHVLYLTARQALKFQFHATTSVVMAARDARPKQSAAALFVHDCYEIVHHMAIVPLSVARHFRGTREGGLGGALRLMLLGAMIGAATIMVDIKRAIHGSRKPLHGGI